MVYVSLPTLHIYIYIHSGFLSVKTNLTDTFRYLKRWIGQRLTQGSFLELGVLSTKVPLFLRLDRFFLSY